MGFFNKIFHPRRAESVVLIDVSAGSVAGAYARYSENETPSLLYTHRVPLEVREDEPQERALERALEILGSSLITEGAPILARHSGSGSADIILVSIDAPWKETKIRKEHFERTEPFIFTEKMVTTALEKTSVVPPGKILTDESVIGASLNGYHVSEPYGKKAHRASVTVFTSFIDANVSKSIETTIRRLFHTTHIHAISGTSLRYQAIRAAFPYEGNALIVDAVGPLVSIELVRNNTLVAVEEESDESIKGAPNIWIKKITDEFVKLAERYPLPRTIFLLAQEPGISSLEQELNSATLGGLWLSDNPPKIVPVLASHIVGSVKQVATTPPDLPLLLMALYWHRRSSVKKA